MKSFTFTLNVQADARDSEEALDIARACKAILEGYSAYKIHVEIDDLEEV